MPNRQEHRRLTSQIRKYRRLCRVYLIISAVGIGLFVTQTAERARDARTYENTIDAQASEIAQCRTTTEIIQATPGSEEAP